MLASMAASTTLDDERYSRREIATKIAFPAPACAVSKWAKPGFPWIRHDEYDVSLMQRLETLGFFQLSFVLLQADAALWAEVRVSLNAWMRKEASPRVEAASACARDRHRSR